ncbi:MAG: cysteine desulfurase [Schleiferiaceae bacterium]
MNPTLDISSAREQFPILQREVNGRPLVYFDNAASTQKPQVVMDAITSYYSTINSNVHRGVHHLSQEATEAMESSRVTVQNHINAEKSSEVIFTKGTTDGINTIAYGLRELIEPGQEVVISAMEHHSNIVPWQMLCEKIGATLKVIPMNEHGELIMAKAEELITDKTAVVAVNHVSNALGTINPVEELGALARKANACFVIDGAQSVPHMKVDVQAIDADFYVFSGHKIFGPTGIGIMYGKSEWLEKLPPYQGGGEMIKTVTFEKTTYAEAPFKFEAGTPNIEGAITLGTAIDFVNSIGMDAIAAHEAALLEYAIEKGKNFPGLRMIGTAQNKASVFSFVVEGTHPYDVGVLLDKMGVAVRTGHHCTQPIMEFFEIPGTIRASFAFYNTFEEVDKLFEALEKAVSMLK